MWLGVPFAKKRLTFSYPMPNPINFAFHSETAINALAGGIAMGYLFGLPAVRC